MTQKERASRPSGKSITLLPRTEPLDRAARDDGVEPAVELVPAIAENIRRLRVQRGLKTSDLASRSGLSASLIDRIEQGDETPTIRRLWGLATALGVPFAQLVQQEPRSESRAQAEAQRVKRRAVVRPPSSGVQRTELYELTVPPGGREQESAGSPDTHETLLVTSGRLVVQMHGREHVLAAGDALAVPGGARRTYENRGAEPVVAYLKVSPPELD
jgi:transcriptional regulator with XRE-family HTH domain